METGRHEVVAGRNATARNPSLTLGYGNQAGEDDFALCKVPAIPAKPREGMEKFLGGEFYWPGQQRYPRETPERVWKTPTRLVSGVSITA